MRVAELAQITDPKMKKVTQNRLAAMRKQLSHLEHLKTLMPVSRTDSS